MKISFEFSWRFLAHLPILSPSYKYTVLVLQIVVTASAILFVQFVAKGRRGRVLKTKETGIQYFFYPGINAPEPPTYSFHASASFTDRL